PRRPTRSRSSSPRRTAWCRSCARARSRATSTRARCAPRCSVCWWADAVARAAPRARGRVGRLDPGAGAPDAALGALAARPPLPRSLKVVRIEPGRVKVRLERVVRRTLPVRPELAGLPPLGYTPEAGVTPGEVEVSGPASKVEELKEIKTEPLELRSAPEAFS